MHPTQQPSRVSPQTAAPASHAPRRRMKWRKRDLILWGVGLAVLIAAVVTLVVSDTIDFKAISEAISRLNPVLVIVLMALLPLAGFSISIVYLVVGARFG